MFSGGRPAGRSANWAAPDVTMASFEMANQFLEQWLGRQRPGEQGSDRRASAQAAHSLTHTHTRRDNHFSRLSQEYLFNVTFSVFVVFKTSMTYKF